MTTTKSPSHRTPAKSSRTSEAIGKPKRSTQASGEARRRHREQPHAAPARASPNGATKMSAEEIRVLVSDAAYMRAQARNFEPGHDLDDWYAAEAEISEQLTRGC